MISSVAKVGAEAKPKFHCRHTIYALHYDDNDNLHWEANLFMYEHELTIHLTTYLTLSVMESKIELE